MKIIKIVVLCKYRILDIGSENLQMKWNNEIDFIK